MVQNMIALLKSKEFQNYMQCLEKGNDKQVTQLKALFGKLVNNVGEINNLKTENKDVFEKTLELVSLSKKIVEIETDRKLISYGIKQCGSHLTDLTIHKNKLQLQTLQKAEDNLKELQRSLQLRKKSQKKAK